MFRDNLKAARLRVGYSRKDMADMLGVAQSMYGYYETGRSEPPLSKLVKIAQILHVSIDSLLDNEPDEYERCHNIFKGEGVEFDDFDDGRIKVTVHHADYSQAMIMTKDDFIDLVHSAERRDNNNTRAKFYRIFTDAYSYVLHMRITNEPIVSIKAEPLEYIDTP